MDKFIKEKIRVTSEQVKKLSERTVFEVEELKYIPTDYKKTGYVPPLPDESWKSFGRTDRVFGNDKHFWFYAHILTPSTKENEEVILEAITDKDNDWDVINPQIILYLNGEISQGMDIHHRIAYLEPSCEYDVFIYFYTGMIESATELKLNVKIRNKLIMKFYYDLRVPYEAAVCLEDDDYNSILTLKYLEHACNILDLRDSGEERLIESVITADKYLEEEYYGAVCGKGKPIVNYMGHTHIDVAWLWTVAQTKEKVQRTFSTVLKLMDRYDFFTFMSSQPQLYAFLKEEAPKLYDEVKKRIKEGRWEAEGAMWLEADCNLTSGESLIRQIIRGKRFMMEEFDKDSKILWLPDVFGYSSALPQILKKCGVDTFVTSKIAWNEMNKMPYDTFMWKGIDGTEIFTYFLTAQDHDDYKNNKFYTTYVGLITPQMNLGTWERYQQKEYSDETLVTFGYGDGGGGPSEEMLEYEKRLEFGLPGQPTARMSTLGGFINEIKKDFEENCMFTGRIPKWAGELYLEYHRGTYTSISKNKKNNRECEFLCMDAETVCVIDNVMLGGVYPKDTIEKAWDKILLNQFHDIIPGSSIYDVYQDSDRDYEEIRASLGSVQAEKFSEIARNISKKGIAVYNPNSFMMSGYVCFNGKRMFVKNVPSKGWRVLDKGDTSNGVTIDGKVIESPYYIIHFDDNMNIISLFDKENEREVVKNGKVLNAICAFEDYPACIQYDNWELNNFYKQKKYEINDVSEVKEIIDDGFAGFEITRKYLNSVIWQRIIVYGESRRIDFETNIDWHEHHTILKALFPVDINSNSAAYDIQFGNIERPNHDNTSWDAMKFEVCAHKWSDISEEGYGVSVLNNCKYGHSVYENEMTLTLLTCGTYPNPLADQGEHSFIYSIYPHKNGFRQGGTIKEAYILNNPFVAFEAEGNGKLPGEFSFISCDSDNIVIETVKQSENGKGIIIRLFDAWNKKSKPTLTFAFKAKKICICDMLENEIESLGSGNSVSFEVGNYEIMTLYLEI